MTKKLHIDIETELGLVRSQLSTKMRDFETLKGEVDKLQAVINALENLKTHYASNEPIKKPSHPHTKTQSSEGLIGRDELVLVSTTPSISNPAPISSACLAALRALKRPVRMTELDKHLKRQGMKLSRNSTWMALQRLEAKKLVRKVDRGLYQAVNGTG